MSALFREYEDRCEHAAQPSFDADDCRSAAIDELVAERLSEVPSWVRMDFTAGRQSESSADPRYAALPDWLKEELLMAHIPDLRTCVRDSLTDEDIDERAAEVAQCVADQ